MAIKKKSEMPRRPIEIDLTGPEGNVFVLMGYVHNFAKQLDLKIDERANDVLCELLEETPPKNAAEMICKQMMESDYDNAVEVFDKYFGSFCTLYR